MAFTRTAAIAHLRRAHNQNRLAHAYLISGPPGSGKRSLAADVAAVVNGTKADQVFTTAAQDIVVIEPRSKGRQILIDEIRALEHVLQMQSSGRRKVAIIDEADRINAKAANAFLKTLEEPPANSLLLLLTAMPEVLPETILSRCISIPLSASGEDVAMPERAELVKLLADAAHETKWEVQHAYRLAQRVQSLLGGIREQIKTANAESLKNEEARYRNSTDGAWLDDREDYYKALTESLYIQRRANLVEVLLEWWSDVLRVGSNVGYRDLPGAKKETATLAKRFAASEILRRIQRLEKLRDHLGRNIQEALAIEVAFLEVFGS
jgi:DNA polymerase-3 subunit delta'